MKQPIKKLKIIAVAGALLLASLFSGCDIIDGLKSKRPELPAYAESVSRYIPDSSSLAHIDVNGRTYVPFASVKGNMFNSEFRECLGYLDDNRSERIYTLCDDPFDNYLVVMNIDSFMDSPSVWRDFATYNKDILTPDFVDPLGNEEWGHSGCYSEMKEFDIDILLEADDVYELSMDYKVYGEDCGTTGVRNANKTELKRGEVYGIEVSEISIYGKFDKDGPLDVECHFHVETMNGEMHDLEYVYKDTVEFGYKISLTLTGNAQDGYVLK